MALWRSYALILVAAGCQQILGIEEGQPPGSNEGPGAGGSAGHGDAGAAADGGGQPSGGAGGGSGGGEEGTLAPSWLGSMNGAYLFDGSPANADYSDNENDLFPNPNAIIASTSLTPQGAGHALVTTPGAFAAPDNFLFNFTGSMTFGGWFKAADADVFGLGRTNSNRGYVLDRNGTHVRCSVGDGTLYSVGPPTYWPAGEWVHLVCRASDFGAALASYVAGAQTAFDTVVGFDSESSATFTVYDPGFPGELDEIFFVTGALNDDSIRRIWTCGIDGAKCRCSRLNPIGYEDCNLAMPTCDSLPPCNQAAPATVQ